MPPIKPGRWTVDPSLLDPLGRELSRGLVDLLPFWDDAPSNVADGFFTGNTKYGWAAYGAWLDKQQPTSRGAGWQNNATSGIYLRTDRALNSLSERQVDWTHMFVVRVDSNTQDFGLHGFDGGNQFWLDTSGSQLRIGTQTSAGILYGSSFHATSDNGTTYVIVYRNDDTNNQTGVFVDGVNHISPAGVAGTGTNFMMVAATSATSKNMNGAIVEFARWNRALTDTEILSLSADPFLLLRPAVLETETATATQDITPGLASQLATASDPTVTTGTVDVTPGLATQAASASDPTLTTTVDVTPGLASQLATATDPTLTTGVVDVTPGLATQLATAIDPVVALGTGTQTVTPELAANLATAYDPAVTTGAVTITPELVTQLATATDPAIATVVYVLPATAQQLATTFDPAVTTGTANITPELVTQLAAAFNPTISAFTITWTEGSSTVTTISGSMSTSTIEGTSKP